MSEAYKDKSTLEELYVDRGLTVREIGDMLDCHNATVSYWLNKHDIEAREKKTTPEEVKSREFLEEKYVEEGLNQKQIADLVGCGSTTVSRWLRKHGIETRDDAAESYGFEHINRERRKRPMRLYTDEDGYERWSAGVAVHQLLAVAEFGFDAVADKVVHHGASPEESTTPWDNRPENLELMTNSEHVVHHWEQGDYVQDESGQFQRRATDDAE